MFSNCLFKFTRLAAMSLVDSTAVFESRALAIGLSAATVNALGLKGWVTHATFAFSVATNSAAGDDQASDHSQSVGRCRQRIAC